MLSNFFFLAICVQLRQAQAGWLQHLGLMTLTNSVIKQFWNSETDFNKHLLLMH